MSFPAHPGFPHLDSSHAEPLNPEAPNPEAPNPEAPNPEAPNPDVLPGSSLPNQLQPLTHLSQDAEAQMVDVSAKPVTIREATAVGWVRMRSETLAAIAAGDAPKGDVLGTARLAGIMAAKQTAQLIPLCHPLPLQKVEVRLEADTTLPGYRISATVKTKAETGVEMEALTAVSVAALTLYDMAKALEKSMVIGGIQLLSKIGGKSGTYHADAWG